MAKPLGSTNQKVAARRARIIEMMEKRFAESDTIPSRKELREALTAEKKWGIVTFKMIYDDLTAIGKESTYLRDLSESHLSTLARNMVESLTRIAKTAEETGENMVAIRAQEALNSVLNGRIGDASIVLLNSKLKQTENRLAQVEQELDELKK